MPEEEWLNVIFSEFLLASEVSKFFGKSEARVITGKGGRTTGARGALAPLKFVEGGLSPPYVMAL